MSNAAVLAADEAPDEVTFCAYNLKNWLLQPNSFDPAQPPKDKPQKEKAKVISFLKEIAPDILGVCEIGTDRDFADLREHLKAAGLHYEHFERAHGGDTTRSLGLLSRFPIVARNSQTGLTYYIGEQKFPVQRGILDASIQITPSFGFRVLGVHLKSMREVPEADQALMRRNEAHLLRQHIERLLKAEPETKLLTYGDFNDHPKNPPIDAIRGDRATPSTQMTDIYLKDVNGQVWTHFYDWEDTYSRLDYVFVNKAMHPHIRAKESLVYAANDFDQASDHRPLVVRISLSSTRRKR